MLSKHVEKRFSVIHDEAVDVITVLVLGAVFFVVSSKMSNSCHHKKKTVLSYILKDYEKTLYGNPRIYLHLSIQKSFQGVRLITQPLSNHNELEFEEFLDAPVVESVVVDAVVVDGVELSVACTKRN